MPAEPLPVNVQSPGMDTQLAEPDCDDAVAATALPVVLNAAVTANAVVVTTRAAARSSLAPRTCHIALSPFEAAVSRERAHSYAREPSVPGRSSKECRGHTNVPSPTDIAPRSGLTSPFSAGVSQRPRVRISCPITAAGGNRILPGRERSPGHAAPPRLDLAAAPGDPRAAAHPVRGLRAELRRARRRSRRARGRQGTLDRRRPPAGTRRGHDCGLGARRA